ncbi:hypothetical protein [Anaerovibrio sp.]|uniref:hypothetical protein n=1 Tax=Anaerovibrio sp. TaxID=1872532 RepID=UPI0025C52F8E|nr:hypothetical protein [Anaerovibrio sp.]MBR2141834.1 hypothetical protein [Anaerovibrio sp.]
MTTEILGFIIIVGAVIVLLARRQMQKADEDVEALEISADKLRRELEQSADEIIGRMAGHIDHLEKLLREADYKTDILERRIGEAESLRLDEPSRRGIATVDSISHPVEDSNSSNSMTAAQLKALEAIREASMALEAAQNQLGVDDYDNDTDAVSQDEYVSGSGDEFAQSDELKTGDLSEKEDFLDNEPSTTSHESFEEVLSDAYNSTEAVFENGAGADIGHVDFMVPSEKETPAVADSLDDNGMDLAAADEDEAVQKYLANEVTNPESGEMAVPAGTLSVEEATIIAKKLLLAGFQPEEVGKLTGLDIGAVSLLAQVSGESAQGSSVAMNSSEI